MKKILVVCIALFALVGSVSAQQSVRTPAVPYGEGKDGVNIYKQEMVGEWEIREEGEKTLLTNEFVMPFSWVGRDVILFVAGVRGDYSVRLNGKMVGGAKSVMTPMEFDVTADVVEQQRNRVEIVLSRSELDSKKEVYGIEAYAISQPRIKIRDYTSLVQFQGADATMELGVVVSTSLLNRKSYRVDYQLIDPDGGEVSSARRDAEIGHRGEDTVRFFINIPNARRWTDESPSLYTLRLNTIQESRVAEQIEYRVGLRSIERVGREILINGYPVLFSMCEYGERLGLKQTQTRLEQIKLSGFNLVKLTGGRQADYLYETCDSIGLYVCDQANINTVQFGESIAQGGNPTNDPKWLEEYLERVKAMYYRSHNRASVVMFSIAERSANGFNLYESYLALKELESGVPIVYFDAKGEWNSDAVASNKAADNQLTISTTPQVVVGSIEPIIESQGERGYLITNPAKNTAWYGEVVVKTLKGRKKVLLESRIELILAPQQAHEIEIAPYLGGGRVRQELTLEGFN